MSQIIITTGLEYFNGERVWYADRRQGPVEFSAYFFESEEALDDWKRRFTEELEKLNLEFGLKPDYVRPVFLPVGDPDEALRPPTPEEMVSNLRSWWIGLVVS